MADQVKKEIEIEIVTNAKAFRDGLKATSKDAVSFNNNIKSLQKAGLKDDKILQKVTKDFAKLNSQQGKQALKQEQGLQKVLHQKLATLKALHKQGKQNTAEFEKEQKSLKETADLYADIKKKRIQTTGLTREEKSEKSGLGKGLKTVGAGAALGVAGLIVGAIKSRITDALDAATEYNNAAIESLGDQSFDKEARSRARGAGRIAAFSATDTMHGAGQVVRQTGQAEDVGMAQQLSRASMMDLSRSIEFLGQQARGGIKGAQAKREQEKIIAAGFTAGMTRGRLGEFIQGVAQLSESAQGRTAGDVKSSGFADILAAFGKSGRSGLQGQRGAAVLQQLEQGVITPGAGEAGQSLVLRSKGFGVPGGTTDYYTALKRQQAGFAGEKGADELKSFIDQLQVEFGKGSQAAVLAGSETTGVSIDIMEKVMKVVNTFSGDSKDLKKQIAELTKESIPIEEQVKEILDDEIAESLKAQVKLSDILVRQGTDLLPISLDIRNSVNELITIMLDKLIPIFLDIRDFVKTLLGYFGGVKFDAKELGDKISAKREEFKDTPDAFKEYLKGYLESIEKSLQDEYKGSRDAGLINSLVSQRQVVTDALINFNSHNKPVDYGSGTELPNNNKNTAGNDKSVSNMSSQELEDAVARGTAKGSKDVKTQTSNTESPTVNVPPPVVKTTIISSEPIRVQNR